MKHTGMADRPPRTTHKMRVFGIIVLVKAVLIIVALVLLREFQIQFSLSVAMLVLLHVATVAALVVYKLRGRFRHGWRR